MYFVDRIKLCHIFSSDCAINPSQIVYELPWRHKQAYKCQLLNDIAKNIDKPSPLEHFLLYSMSFDLTPKRMFLSKSQLRKFIDLIVQCPEN